MSDRNYEQDLRDLIERWDPIIKKVRESHSEADSKGFLSAFAMAVLADLKSLVESLKGIPGIILVVASGLAVIGAYVEWSFLLDAAEYLKSESIKPYYISIGLFVIVGFLGFVIWKMADPQYEHFHITAYRWVKPSEYKAMLPFFDGNKKFTFEDLSERFITRESLSDEIKETYKMITDLQQQVRQKEKELQAEKDKHQNTKIVFEQAAKDLIDEKNALLEVQSDQLEVLFDILNEVRINIERYINGTFSTSDLGFLAPYTLYRLQGDRLIKIDDVRTSSHGKNEIIISEHPDYATVRVLTHPQPYWVTDFEPGRRMLSLRMDMLDGEVWVINFHINWSNERLVKLLFEDDIIGSTTLFDLIRAHCRLAQLAAKSKRSRKSQRN